MSIHSRTRRLLAAILAACPLAAAAATPMTVPVYGYKVVNTYPHDPNAFTEGLFFQDGYLYESTGLEGHSSVRKVRLESGKVVDGTKLPDDIFGEGITAWDDRLIGLTWKTQVGYVLDLKTLGVKSQFSYPGEGWGLTHSDRELVMSDGTSELRFLDPSTLHELRRVKVTAAGKPVLQLNELEWIEGEVWANVWQTDRIARIDPKTGNVVGWIDLAGLLPRKDFIPDRTDVLNGIAYDAAARRVFVTGKLWPKLFEIQVVPRPAKR
jgi:glutamine cyclotransferase